MFWKRKPGRESNGSPLAANSASSCIQLLNSCQRKQSIICALEQFQKAVFNPPWWFFFFQPSNLCKGFKSCNDACLYQAWGYHTAPQDTVSPVCKELQPWEFYFLQNCVLCHIITSSCFGLKSGTVTTIYFSATWQRHKTGTRTACNPCIWRAQKELQGNFWPGHCIL